jgi:thiol-disulfide isomerase/thioredoxin
MRVPCGAGVVLLSAALLLPAQAGVLLDPQVAPQWQVSEWLNADPGPLAGQAGRVVIIHFFQVWCPGCASFSVPLFQHWQETYGQREDVLILGIHTVFEGHDVQTPQSLRQFLLDKGIRYPVGIDAYDGGDRVTPVTMRRFDTGGTPHVAIVDRYSRLVFSHFGRFDPAPVEAFIDRLLKETAAAPTRPKHTPVRD